MVFFPPKPEILRSLDFILLLPLLRQFTEMDSLPFRCIQRITKHADKSMRLHGHFAYRRITFCSRRKRDECIALILQNDQGRIKVVDESR